MYKAFVKFRSESNSSKNIVSIFTNPSKDILNVKGEQVQFGLEIPDLKGAKFLISSNILNNESD